MIWLGILRADDSRHLLEVFYCFDHIEVEEIANVAKPALKYS